MAFRYVFYVFGYVDKGKEKKQISKITRLK